MGQGLPPEIAWPLNAPQAARKFEVEPRGTQLGEQYPSMIHPARVLETASIVEALDPAFHHGFFTRTTRLQQGGFAAMTRRHSVPAQGEHRTLAVASTDLPNTFEEVRWDPATRQVHLDWTNVTCNEPYVLLLTNWSLKPTCVGPSECSGRPIDWTMLSPASDSVRLPALPAEIDDEVLRAMADPSFSLNITVLAWAGKAPYATLAGFDGATLSPSDLGDRACHIGRSTSIR